MFKTYLNFCRPNITFGAKVPQVPDTVYHVLRINDIFAVATSTY